MDIKKVSKFSQTIKDKYKRFMDKLFYPTVLLVVFCIGYTVYDIGHGFQVKQAEAKTAWEHSIQRPIHESCLADCKTLEEHFTGQEKTRPESPAELILSLDWPEAMLPIVMWESGGWSCEINPDAENSTMNKDGSIDRGTMQINSHTFADYQRRMPSKMHALGIETYEDMWDWEKNIKMGYLIYSYQGLNAWSSYNSQIYKVCERYVR